MFRLALEDDFFYFVALALNYARYLWFQRCSLGKFSDRFEKFIAKALLILSYLLRRRSLLIIVLPLLESFLGLTIQVMIHHITGQDAVDSFRQDLKIFVRQRHGINQKRQAYNHHRYFMSIHNLPPVI